MRFGHRSGHSVQSIAASILISKISYWKIAAPHNGRIFRSIGPRRPATESSVDLPSTIYEVWNEVSGKVDLWGFAFNLYYSVHYFTTSIRAVRGCLGIQRG